MGAIEALNRRSFLNRRHSGRVGHGIAAATVTGRLTEAGVGLRSRSQISRQGSELGRAGGVSITCHAKRPLSFMLGQTQWR